MFKANMDSESWHSALIGGNTPEIVAARLQRRDVTAQPWVDVLLENVDGNTTLELGSGTGELSAILAMANCQVSLLDFSAASLTFSRRLFELLHLDAHYYNADVLLPLPFPNNAFDCVFSSGLLEHFTGSQQYSIIAEAARVCSNVLITFVPNAMSIAYRLGKFAQERAGTWKWGKEDPLLTMRDLYQAAGIGIVGEFSIDPDHSLRFLNTLETIPVARVMKSWFDSLSLTELNNLNQGYLLACIGVK